MQQRWRRPVGIAYVALIAGFMVVAGELGTNDRRGDAWMADWWIQQYEEETGLPLFPSDEEEYAPYATLPPLEPLPATAPTSSPLGVDATVRELDDLPIDFASLDDHPVCGSSERIVTVTVAGDEATDAWASARAALPRTGRWPLLLGTPAEAEGTLQQAEQLCEDGHTVDAELQRAAMLDVEHWFAERVPYIGLTAGDLRAAEPRFGPPAPVSGIRAVSDGLTLEPLDAIVLALLPTADPVEVPAVLGWGGWNDAHVPAVHAALFARWHEAHGAEPVVMSSDLVEMYVASPPATWDGAASVAREHVLYAPDDMLQGTGRFVDSVEQVLGASTWSFWFD